jgi:SAM-dependent methyltransferase
VARRLLQSAGLLDLAREARDVAVSVRWLQDNTRLWRHGSPDGLPVPPLRLVRSSTGTSSLEWLFHGGSLAAESVTGILDKNGVDIRACRTILDFGCGCGRVLRQWAGLDARIHGCDYNRRCVEWCRRNLPFASVDVNELTPPLRYDDGQFDLVYALSVFTHLPEPLLFAWMREMKRIVTPGRFLIVSTHGESYLGELTPEQRAQFQSRRAVVKDQNAAGTNRCGVYLSEGYVRERLTDGFSVVDFVPRGATGNPVQDLVLLHRNS